MYRKVRIDGNCFYRAVGYAYLEHLFRPTTAPDSLANLETYLMSNETYFQLLEAESETCKQHRSKMCSLLKELIDFKKNKRLEYLFDFL
mmetsp:Transcript_24093/g.11581  ORF Transcript_24093/g.11581 Transcript_24093/m.11581 type:complete len:89 (+) Transcript_24093:55-321(+)